MDDRTPKSDQDSSWLERLLPMALERASESEAPLQPPTDEEVDEYLAGGLEPQRREEIQQVLIGSRDQRKKMIERGQEIERLAELKRRGFLEMIAGWFRRPMILVPVAAVAVVVAVLIGRRPDTTPMMSLARVMRSVPSGMSSIELPAFERPRGSTEPAPVAVELPANQSVIILQLSVVVFRGDSPPTAVEIRDPSGLLVWSGILSAEDIANDTLFLQLDAQALVSGDYSITVLDEGGEAIVTSAFRR